MPEVKVKLEHKFDTTITTRTHTVKADEPVDKGGDDQAPTPAELLLSAIGACQAITVKMYAERKGWPLERIEMELSQQKVKPEECPEYDNSKELPQVDVITTRVRLYGDLTEEQKIRLTEIAGKCPVHKTVANGAHFIEELET